MGTDDFGDVTPEPRPETDTQFHEGDKVQIVSGNFTGKRGVIERVSYGQTIYYQVRNDDPESDPFPPIYLSAGQIRAV